MAVLYQWTATGGVQAVVYVPTLVTGPNEGAFSGAACLKGFQTSGHQGAVLEAERPVASLVVQPVEEAGGPVTHFGASSASITFTATTAQPRLTAVAASSGRITFSATTAATKKTFGASSGTITFTATTAARRKALGASSASIVFSATTAARLTLRAASAGRITFTATTNGVVFGPGAVTHFGASSATIVFTGTTAARKKTFGASAGTIALTGTTSAYKKTFGASLGNIVFSATTAPRLTARAVSVGRITFTATTNGNVAGAPPALSPGSVLVTDAGAPGVLVADLVGAAVSVSDAAHALG